MEGHFKVQLQSATGDTVQLQLKRNESLGDSLKRARLAQKAMDGLMILRKNKGVSADGAFTAPVHVMVDGQPIPLMADSSDTAEDLARKAEDATGLKLKLAEHIHLNNPSDPQGHQEEEDDDEDDEEDEEEEDEEEDDEADAREAKIVDLVRYRSELQRQSDVTPVSLVAMLKLSGEPTEAQAEQVFSRFDADKNGVIDEKELEAACDTAQVAPWRAMRTLDLNRDNAVSKEEFLNWWQRVGRAAPSSARSGGPVAVLRRANAQTDLVSPRQLSPPKTKAPVQVKDARPPSQQSSRPPSQQAARPSSGQAVRPPSRPSSRPLAEEPSRRAQAAQLRAAVEAQIAKVNKEVEVLRSLAMAAIDLCQ